MNPFWKDILREINATKARFISLTVITMLGAMSVVGIRATSIDMRDAADRMYKERGLYDLQLKSSTGFSAGDTAAVIETEGVAEVMPTYIFDVYADIRGKLTPIRAYAVPDTMNTVSVVDGRLPERDGECAVERGFLRAGGWSLGDSVSLCLDDMEKYHDVLRGGTFTITGVVSSPLYISYERGRTTLGSGSLNYYAYLHPDAYTLGVYTDLYVVMDGSREMYNVSDAYANAADGWKETLEKTADARAAVFSGELRDAQAKIDDGWAEYYSGAREADEKMAEGRAELADALEKLGEAKAELETAQNTLNAEIADGLDELRRGEERLEAGRRALNAREAELNAGQEELDAARLELLANLEALSAAVPWGASPETDAQYEMLYGALELLTARQAELDGGRMSIDAAREEIRGGFAELSGARETIEAERADAQAKIDDGWTEYFQGLKSYEEGLDTLNTEEASAREKLAEAKEELQDAQSELDGAPEPEWYIFTRKDGASFESYYQDTLRLQKVGYVFPMVFFLVAVLVSLTTMSRMVEEQRSQIGVYKALGCRPAAIMLKYAIYALLSGLIGGAAGVAAGSVVFPLIITDAYGHLYFMPPVETPLPLGISAAALAASVASVMSVTLMTCAGAMSGEPAGLMRPKAPKIGKRVLLEKIPFIWNRLGFIGKVTARNIFRYKRRFLMTLIGVAGCTALLLTAFGLRDSIGGVALSQYRDVIKYGARAYLKDITERGQRESLNALTPDSRLYVREESVEVKNARGAVTAALITPETINGFGDFISVPEFNGGGVVLTEKLARTHRLSPGDRVEFTAGDNRTYSAAVAAIAENYVLHFVYMPPEAYAELFGAAPVMNGLLINGDFNAEELMKNENVRGFVSTADQLSSLGDSTDALGVVTVVLLILACALAFVVLFNLTVINMTERMRELATIKVLGFQDIETAMYTYRENLAVTSMGIALGLIGGVFLNGFVLSSVEIDMLKFPRGISPASFVLAAALSLVFALFVNAATYRKLVNIDMVESLKNVE